MAEDIKEPLDDVLDLEIKELRLELLDIVSEYTNGETGYTPYMCMYEEELEALEGLTKEKQRKGLKDIADKVITSHDRGVWRYGR